MYTVTGVSYPVGRQQSSALQRAEDVGLGDASNPEHINVDYGGSESRTLLTVGWVFTDGSHVFPGVEVTDPIVVALPSPGFRQLDVRIQYDYARETQVIFKRPYAGPVLKHEFNCRDDIQSGWYLRESELIRFTRGTQVVTTNWCAQPGSERVFSDVFGPPGSHISGAEVSHNDHAYGLNSSLRFDMFVLPPL